jgi:glc operon protein GlcG
MTFLRCGAVAAVTLALFAAPAQAQQAAANPLDAVPEKIPFDVPYGAPITLERAEAVLNAALGESRSRGWKLVCAVVDSGAQLVALKRQDGAQLASIDIAAHKARTAVKYRRETKAFEAGIQGGNIYLLTLDDVIGSRGGIPLVQGGALAGAVGCSGGTGSQDEVAARVGVAALR